MKSHVRRILLSLILSIFLIFSIGTAAFGTAIPKPDSQIETSDAALNGFDYLALQLNEDGGIRWIEETSNTATTLRVVLALAAAGLPQDYLISDSGNRPIDFLAMSAADWISESSEGESKVNLARAGQVSTAVAAANENPHAFGPSSLNLIYLIKSHYDPNTGVFGNSTSEDVLEQTWSILGLAANYASVPREAVEWLANAQMDDGSWNDGYGSYLDTTPLALLALIASGHKDINAPEIQAAVGYIQKNQQPDGGWQTEYDSTTNANTTGMIMQVIAALEHEPTDEQWQQDNGNPLTALLAIQQEDGSIGGDFINAFSTADAILGLAEQPLFSLGSLYRLNRGFNYVISMQEENGGWGSVGQTIDIMLALHAAGWDPNSITKNGSTPLAFVESDLESYLEAGPDAISKTILAVVVSGEDPKNFAGINLIASLMDTYNDELNAFGDPANTWHQAFAILGVQASQSQIPEGAVETLAQLQQDDGGWEYSPGFGTYPDNSALAVQALAAAGIPHDDDTIMRALEYMQSMQQDEGDWGDSSTTSFVLMALNVLGIAPETWATRAGSPPLQTLFTYQKNNGSFFFSSDFPDDNLMSTATALLASLSGHYLVSPPASEENHYAGLVVDTGEGEVRTACVAFSLNSISGLDLLDKSRFSYEPQDGFMNSIMGVSNPDGGTMYWSYWYWDGRDWIFHNTGAGGSTVAPSAIEAWAFINWEDFPSLPPEYVPSLNEICGQTILKDHEIHPYINFKDIDLRNGEIIPSSQPVEVNDTLETPVAEIETTPTPTTVPQARQEQQTPSIIPILLIAGGGLIIAIVVMIILKRKSQ